jgi:hypothetical protein
LKNQQATSEKSQLDSSAYQENLIRKESNADVGKSGKDFNALPYTKVSIDPSLQIVINKRDGWMQLRRQGWRA